MAVIRIDPKIGRKWMVGSVLQLYVNQNTLHIILEKKGKNEAKTSDIFNTKFISQGCCVKNKFHSLDMMVGSVLLHYVLNSFQKAIQ